MITQFKIFEKIENSENVGCYAIIDIRKKESTGAQVYNDVYGKIIDIGYDKYAVNDSVKEQFLFRPLCPISEKLRNAINHNNSVARNSIISHFFAQKEEMDFWMTSIYVKLYKNENKFKEEVERIKLEKEAEKYNM